MHYAYSLGCILIAALVVAPYPLLALLVLHTPNIKYIFEIYLGIICIAVGKNGENMEGLKMVQLSTVITPAPAQHRCNLSNATTLDKMLSFYKIRFVCPDKIY